MFQKLTGTNLNINLSDATVSKIPTAFLGWGKKSGKKMLNWRKKMTLRILAIQFGKMEISLASPT